MGHNSREELWLFWKKVIHVNAGDPPHNPSEKRSLHIIKGRDLVTPTHSALHSKHKKWCILSPYKSAISLLLRVVPRGHICPSVAWLRQKEPWFSLHTETKTTLENHWEYSSIATPLSSFLKEVFLLTKPLPWAQWSHTSASNHRNVSSRPPVSSHILGPFRLSQKEHRLWDRRDD